MSKKNDKTLRIRVKSTTRTEPVWWRSSLFCINPYWFLWERVSTGLVRCCLETYIFISFRPSRKVTHAVCLRNSTMWLSKYDQLDKFNYIWDAWHSIISLIPCVKGIRLRRSLIRSDELGLSNVMSTALP